MTRSYFFQLISENRNLYSKEKKCLKVKYACKVCHGKENETKVGEKRYRRDGDNRGEREEMLLNATRKMFLGYVM